MNGLRSTITSYIYRFDGAPLVPDMLKIIILDDATHGRLRDGRTVIRTNNQWRLIK